MWYFYVLESQKNKQLYKGITNNLSTRLKNHNSGRGGKFTSKNRPYKLIFYEAYLEKADAQRAEKFFKSGYGREVLKKDKLKTFFIKEKR